MIASNYLGCTFHLLAIEVIQIIFDLGILVADVIYLTMRSHDPILIL